MYVDGIDAPVVLVKFFDNAAMTGEKGRSLLERTLLLFSQNNCGLPQMITVVGEIRRAVAVQAAAG